MHDGWALFDPEGRVVVSSVRLARRHAWNAGMHATGGFCEKEGIRGLSLDEAQAKARKMGWRVVKVRVVPVP